MWKPPYTSYYKYLSKFHFLKWIEMCIESVLKLMDKNPPISYKEVHDLAYIYIYKFKILL